jgi:ComF family protein
MKMKDKLLNLLFPQKCPVCGTLTDGDTSRLCPKCAAALSEELDIRCPLCHKTAKDCGCVPQSLEEQTHICVGFYIPGKRDAVLSRLVYALKERSDASAALIFSRMMAPALMHLFISMGEDPKNWIFVYPPRSASKKAEMGFDHAEQLTRYLARDLGAEFQNVFRRCGGEEQKTLDQMQRQENIRRTMQLRHPEKCRKKKILLIDDILTSGATLSYCTSLLCEAGAEKVLCATALKTLPRKSIPREDAAGRFWFEQ